MPLLDKSGTPIKVTDKRGFGTRAYAKEAPPKLGNQYDNVTGRDLTPFELPGGGLLQFDLSRLTLADFRQMSTHYQINSSLNLQAFMQHQAPWHIGHPSAKVRDFLTENLTQIWTDLIRARAQANWAGYSPSILEWDNYSYDRTTRITKVVDMLPEECRVNWKKVDLYAPPGEIKPKGKVYDGIDKYGMRHPIPAENTFWYALLMENRNYQGRKLLKSVYTSYFFSMCIHLYANRYYERFGQPTPIGRAPLDDEITVNGQTMSGADLMVAAMRNLRSGGKVLLPSDKVEDGNGSAHFEYDLEYLESQMRGADFERMLTRYDQEMALGTFTPLLLQQTADIGSYNLGGLHYQMYLHTQNSMNADFALFVNKYILMPLIRVNFSASTEPAYLIFEEQDNTKADLVKMIIQALIAQGTLGVDVDQLGKEAGLTLKQIQAIKQATPGSPAPNDPTATGDAGGGSGNQNDGVPAGQTAKPSKNARAELRNAILDRVRNQVYNAMNLGTFGPDTSINIPYGKQLAAQYPDYPARDMLQAWADMAVQRSWSNADHFRTMMHAAWDTLMENSHAPVAV